MAATNRRRGLGRPAYVLPVACYAPLCPVGRLKPKPGRAFSQTKESTMANPRMKKSEQQLKLEEEIRQNFGEHFFRDYVPALRDDFLIEREAVMILTRFEDEKEQKLQAMN